MTTRLADLRSLLYTDVARAKAELGKHMTEVRLIPEERDGKRHYVADGQWNLLGGYEGDSRQNQRVRVIAGGGFEPPTFGL